MTRISSAFGIVVLLVALVQLVTLGDCRIQPGIYKIKSAAHINQVVEAEGEEIIGWEDEEKDSQLFHVLPIAYDIYVFQNLESQLYISRMGHRLIASPQPYRFLVIMESQDLFRIEAVEDRMAWILPSGQNGASIKLARFTGKGTQLFNFLRSG
jgi:hypothetical protein